MRASRWDAEATPLGEPARIEQERTAELDADALVERVARALDGAGTHDVTAVATVSYTHLTLPTTPYV